MKSPDVAVQIVNYKTKAFLDPLIESIVKDIAGSKLIVEINILDNASGDKLEDIAKKWRHQNVHVHQSDKNGGYGAGHNILAGKTKAEYLLLLNPDLLFVEPRTIGRLLETAKQTKAAVVGPKLVTPRPGVDRSGRQFSPGQLRQQPWDHWKHNVARYSATRTPAEVMGVSGAVFLIEHREFEVVGGFDEKFFLYYEEVDLCDRLLKSGRHIFYNPDIVVLHYVGGAGARKLSVYGIKANLRLQLKRLKRWRQVA